MKLGTPLSPSALRVMLLGSGELGKEVLIALQRLGVETIAVDRYPNAPGHQVAHRAHVIAMTDGAALRALVEQEKPHLIVPEIEAIATDMLVQIEAEGLAAGTIAEIASRMAERTRRRLDTLFATAASLRSAARPHLQRLLADSVLPARPHPRHHHRGRQPAARRPGRPRRALSGAPMHDTELRAQLLATARGMAASGLNKGTASTASSTNATPAIIEGNTPSALSTERSTRRRRTMARSAQGIATPLAAPAIRPVASSSGELCAQACHSAAAATAQACRA